MHAFARHDLLAMKSDRGGQALPRHLAVDPVEIDEVHRRAALVLVGDAAAQAGADELQVRVGVFGFGELLNLRQLVAFSISSWRNPASAGKRVWKSMKYGSIRRPRRRSASPRAAPPSSPPDGPPVPARDSPPWCGTSSRGCADSARVLRRGVPRSAAGCRSRRTGRAGRFRAEIRAESAPGRPTGWRTALGKVAARSGVASEGNATGAGRRHGHARRG